MSEIACAFTGHRPKSFPWKNNETDPGCVFLKEVLAEQIKLLADRGVTDWLSGMAQGVDLWAAEIVLGLKEKISLCASTASFPVRDRSASGRHRSGNDIILFCGKLMK